MCVFFHFHFNTHWSISRLINCIALLLIYSSKICQFLWQSIIYCKSSFHNSGYGNHWALGISIHTWHPPTGLVSIWLTKPSRIPSMFAGEEITRTVEQAISGHLWVSSLFSPLDVESRTWSMWLYLSLPLITWTAQSSGRLLAWTRRNEAVNHIRTGQLTILNITFNVLQIVKKLSAACLPLCH